MQIIFSVVTKRKFEYILRINVDTFDINIFSNCMKRISDSDLELMILLIISSWYS